MVLACLMKRGKMMNAAKVEGLLEITSAPGKHVKILQRDKDPYN